ncbi:2074_t:CDS:2 [Funneliformis caledonium]|uniref:2074_t:CDS:1 n=1 Tax=Funneliformis caledonium TaxID=1117310 RepID=A0A9N9DIX5_9GLOM|nr:2074_t:CDS:2 [Funneliformis caledonium]
MGKLEDDLTELKKCYDNDLMTKQDYDDARRNRLGLKQADKSWWEKFLERCHSSIAGTIDSILSLFTGQRLIKN